MNLRALPSLFLTSTKSLLSNIGRIFLFLALLYPAISQAQAPDEMYLNGRAEKATTENVSQANLEHDIEGEIQAVERLQRGINTVSQLININKQRLEQIAKNAIDLNKSAKELEALQDERKVILTQLDEYNLKMEDLRKEKALHANKKTTGNNEESVNEIDGKE